MKKKGMKEMFKYYIEQTYLDELETPFLMEEQLKQDREMERMRREEVIRNEEKS